MLTSLHIHKQILGGLLIVVAFMLTGCGGGSLLDDMETAISQEDLDKAEAIANAILIDVNGDGDFTQHIDLDGWEERAGGRWRSMDALGNPIGDPEYLELNYITPEHGPLLFNPGNQPNSVVLLDAETSGFEKEEHVGELSTRFPNGTTYTRDQDIDADPNSNVVNDLTDTIVLYNNGENSGASEDYLRFGYWLETYDPDPLNPENPNSYNIGVYSGGTNPYTLILDRDTRSQIPAALTGTATYTGNAAGMFVEKLDVPNDNHAFPVPAASGTFTADTTLTADFDAINSSNNEEGFTISGTVNNFMLDTGTGDPPVNRTDWVLNLDQSPVFDLFLAPHGDTSSNGRHAGSWRALFYGDYGDLTNPIQPTGIAGEFIGDSRDWSVIGAFGATKD